MMTKRRKHVRELVERLWAEGVDAHEIARQVGWSMSCTPTTYIAVYRSRGWDLPHRYSEERVRAFREVRWPAKTPSPK